MRLVKQKNADLVTKKCGGDGAVYEACVQILKKK